MRPKSVFQFVLAKGFCQGRRTQCTLQRLNNSPPHTLWYFENEGFIRTWLCPPLTQVEHTKLLRLLLQLYSGTAVALPPWSSRVEVDAPACQGGPVRRGPTLEHSSFSSIDIGRTTTLPFLACVYYSYTTAAL